jgi:hypothetical protein
MAAANNNINRSIGIPTKDAKLCIIQYTSQKYYKKVKATGRETTLEKLREMFPDDNIQAYQENNIESYKTMSEEGPRFFAYHRDGSKDKAYYWDNGNWYGYRTLESVEFPEVHTTHDDDNTPVNSQPPADDRQF